MPKGGEHGLEFQEHRILSGANDVREHSSCVMVERMPEPPFGRFGPDATPHFIYFSGALWPDAHGVGAWTRREHRGVEGLKRGNFFLTRRSPSWD